MRAAHGRNDLNLHSRRAPLMAIRAHQMLAVRERKLLVSHLDFHNNAQSASLRRNISGSARSSSIEGCPPLRPRTLH